MTLVDLFCGLGGWSAGFSQMGWRCVGVDLGEFESEYVAAGGSLFLRRDLLSWDPAADGIFAADLVVASPPCEEFSRWSMPWTRARNPSVPSLDLWRASERVAAAVGAPLVVENVRGAQRFMGRSALNVGAFHLWGAVPALMPLWHSSKRKESWGSVDRSQRAKVPIEVSRWLARCYSQEVAA